MAWAYTVHGSEDGIVTVCGNKKRAVEKAVAYVENAGEEPEIRGSDPWTTYVEGHSTTATVEKFWIE
jgi:hypothetical protein